MSIERLHLQRLLTWFSPAFPVGGFSYSHGLEAAIEGELVTDRASLQQWLGDVLEHGAGWNDAILVCLAHRRTLKGVPLDDLIELALALTATAELRLETTAQGRAFGETVGKVWKRSQLRDLPYPLAVGVASADAGIDLKDVAEAYLHAFAANLVSAAVRAVPLGQTDGLRALAAQEDPITGLGRRVMTADLDQIGGFVPMMELCSMRHETQYTRLFRS